MTVRNAGSHPVHGVVVHRLAIPASMPAPISVTTYGAPGAHTVSGIIAASVSGRTVRLSLPPGTVVVVSPQRAAATAPVAA